MRNGLWQTIIIAVIVLAVVYGRGPARSAPPEPASSTPVAIPVDDPRLAVQARDIAQLQAEVRELRANRPASAAAATAPPATSGQNRRDVDRAERSLTPAEAAAQVLARQQALIEEHDRENLDPNWSPQAAAAFSGHLDAVRQQAGNAFRITASDCRGSSCLARVEWPHCQDAIRHHDAFSWRPGGFADDGPLRNCNGVSFLQAAPSAESLNQPCTGLYSVTCQPAPRGADNRHVSNGWVDNSY